jgi:poly-gamma-glutamate synthesis protein (capsule biosynthesis protein)
MRPAVSIVSALAGTLALVAGSTSAAALDDPAPLTVDSTLPSWLVPGAKLEVDGSADPQQEVQLLEDGRTIATVTADEVGEFTISVRLGSRGVHELSLVATTDTSIDTVGLGRLTVRPLRLAAVGDITPGEAVGPTVSARGAAYPWLSVGKTLRQADIATANLEGAISHRGTPVPGKEFHFEGPVALLTGMRAYAGMDVVTLANNHTLDYGPLALYDTLAAARRTKIATVGAGRNAAAARRPVYIAAGGLRLAFLGYSDVNPAGFNATSSSPGTARAEPAAIEADVRAARRHADLVVCWFHWGTEMVRRPSSAQRALAQAAIRGGAKLVLGAHPHVFGPISRPTRSSLVAWTLGNFVFPAGSPDAVRTGILISTLGAQGVTSYRVVPAASGVQPRLATG